MLETAASARWSNAASPAWCFGAGVGLAAIILRVWTPQKPSNAVVKHINMLRIETAPHHQDLSCAYQQDKTLVLTHKREHNRVKKFSSVTLHGPHSQLVHCKARTRQLSDGCVQQPLLVFMVHPIHDCEGVLSSAARTVSGMCKFSVLKSDYFFLCCDHRQSLFLVRSLSPAVHCGVLCQESSRTGVRTAAKRLKSTVHFPFLSCVCDFLRRSSPFSR